MGLYVLLGILSRVARTSWKTDDVQEREHPRIHLSPRELLARHDFSSTPPPIDHPRLVFLFALVRLPQNIGGLVIRHASRCSTFTPNRILSGARTHISTSLNEQDNAAPRTHRASARAFAPIGLYSSGGGGGGSTFMDSSSSSLVCSNCDRMLSTPRSLRWNLITACWSSNCLMKCELDADLVPPWRGTDRGEKGDGRWTLRCESRNKSCRALTSRLGCAHYVGTAPRAPRR